MIQDIAPHRLRNEFQPEKTPGDGSLVFVFSKGELLTAVTDDQIRIPAFEELAVPKGEEAAKKPAVKKATKASDKKAGAAKKPAAKAVRKKSAKA